MDGSVLGIFNSILALKSWPPSQCLHAISFGTKKLHALQAADLIARESFKHIDNVGVRAMRIPVRRMRESLCFFRWTEKTLNYLAQNGGLDNLELLASWDETPNAPKFRWMVYPKTIKR